MKHTGSSNPQDLVSEGSEHLEAGKNELLDELAAMVDVDIQFEDKTFQKKAGLIINTEVLEFDDTLQPDEDEDDDLRRCQSVLIPSNIHTLKNDMMAKSQEPNKHETPTLKAEPRSQASSFTNTRASGKKGPSNAKSTKHKEAAKTQWANFQQNNNKKISPFKAQPYHPKKYNEPIKKSNEPSTVERNARRISTKDDAGGDNQELFSKSFHDGLLKDDRANKPQK